MALLQLFDHGSIRCNATQVTAVSDRASPGGTDMIYAKCHSNDWPLKWLSIHAFPRIAEPRVVENQDGPLAGMLQRSDGVVQSVERG
ncbi:protein of unknown function [Burkholderia multivorans]